ncbi:lysozyme inhibitor LprI family protein [Achromobacter aegrifaciens]
MSRTRDIIQEIADVRQRRRFGSAMAELPLRLFALEQAFSQHDPSHRELARYFPVALIACIEGYFRMAIKELIDAGDPYLSNAEKPAASIKLDFSILRAVHGKSITVGELVAHGVSLSRLDHIDSVMSNLLGTGLLRELRRTTDRWAHEVMGEPAVPILANPDQAYLDVARTFELRHIICHELASAYEIDLEEVGRCFESCVSFLKAADEFISETLHPGAPLTQTAMNIAAGQSFAQAESLLNEVVDGIKQRLSLAELTTFNDSQAKWQAYADAWIAFAIGEQADGGTIWPLLAAATAETMVKHRLDEVTNWRRLGEGSE